MVVIPGRQGAAIVAAAGLRRRWRAACNPAARPDTGAMGTLGKAAIPLLLALVAVPASAGTVYRCVGGDGISNYVTKRMPGAQCTVASRYTPDRRASRPVAPAPVPAVAAGATTAAASVASASASTVPATTPVAAQARPAA